MFHNLIFKCNMFRNFLDYPRFLQFLKNCDLIHHRKYICVCMVKNNIKFIFDDIEKEIQAKNVTNL